MTIQNDGLIFPEHKEVNHEKWFEHLNSLYGVEYSLLNLAVTVGVVGAPVIAGFIVSLPRNCTSEARINCMTQWELLAIPMGPTLLVLFFGYIFFASRTIGKYTRSLERAIAGNSGATPELRAPALSRLNGALYGGESRRLLPLRLFFQILSFTVVGVEAFTIITVLNRIDDTRARVGGFFFYGLLGLLCAATYGVGASHRTFGDLVQAAIERDGVKNQPIEAMLSWAKFARIAILPRPLSLAKSIDGVIVLAIALLILQSGSDSANVGKALAGLLIFDSVLYQTRYLLNGIREDQGKSFALPSDRRNDPALPYTPAQQFVGPLVAAVRVAAFWYLMVSLDITSGSVAASIVALFFLVYYAYEIPRELARRHLRKAVESVASAAGTPLRVPRRSNFEANDKTFGRVLGAQVPRAWVLFVTVGMGYGLRAFVVLYLVSDSLARSWIGFGLVFSVWAAGSAGACAGWVIEFMGAVTKPGIVPPRIHRNLIAKPQLTWAAGYVKGLVPGRLNFGDFNDDESREADKVSLWQISDVSRSPWRLACLSSILFVAFVAVPGQPARVVVFDIAAFFGLVLYLGTSHRRLGTAKGFSALTLIVAALVAFAASLGKPITLQLACVVAVIWPMWRVKQSESGQLRALIEKARSFELRLDRAGAALVHGLDFFLELAFGYAVVHALSRRFRDTS